MTPDIKFKSIYRGRASFEVRDNGETYRLEYQAHADEYEPMTWNYTPEEYKRDVVGSVGIVWRAISWEQPIPVHVYESFKAYLNESSFSYDSEPVRGYYEPGTGWIKYQ